MTDTDQPKKKAKKEAKQDDGLNQDGFEAGKPVTSEDLLKYMAQQRQKTKSVPPATKPPKPKRRKERSKIHGSAMDKG